MSEKEKKALENTENNEEAVELDDEELENVTGGNGLNPPRVDEHDYDKDVMKRM